MTTSIISSIEQPARQAPWMRRRKCDLPSPSEMRLAMAINSLSFGSNICRAWIFQMQTRHNTPRNQRKFSSTPRRMPDRSPDRWPRFLPTLSNKILAQYNLQLGLRVLNANIRSLPCPSVKTLGSDDISTLRENGTQIRPRTLRFCDGRSPATLLSSP